MLRPDIITKGGDYKPEDVVGNHLVKVVILPYQKNYSTTRLLNAA
jgi:D-beta-D-heptose 7-phosphate kinase/D-beta-D-heptose 1-phosphate adenosyltransferase